MFNYYICKLIFYATCSINNNNSKFKFYVVQFSGLAQTASHKKELIDKEIIIVQVHVCEMFTKILNCYNKIIKIIIVKFK